VCVLLLDVDTPDADGARDADAVVVVLLLLINRFVVIVAGEAVVVVNLEIVRCGYVGVFETIFLLGGSTFATGTSGLVNSIISLLARVFSFESKENG
jgi:hypothetical protein